MKYQEFIEEILELEKRAMLINKLQQEAIAFSHSKRYSEAEQKFKQILELDENHTATWLNLGTMYYVKEQYAEALQALLKCLALDSSAAIQHYTIGLVFEKLDDFTQAIQAYLKAIALDPLWIDAYNQLGNIFRETGELKRAEAVYQQAIAAKPAHFGSYLNLGNTLLEQEQIDAAIEVYEKALELKPRDPNILYNLGVAYEVKNDFAEAFLNYGFAFYRQGKYQEAIEQYQQSLAIKPADAFVYVALADCYKSLKKCDEAVKAYEEGLKLYPQSHLIYCHIILTLQYFGKIKEAIATAQKAAQTLTNSFIFQLEEQRLLPILYEKEEEIEFYRQRFIRGLKKLTEETSLNNLEEKKSALESIDWRTNFYLQYQAKNDLELQKQYGEFVHQVMAANYPEWVKPLSKSSLSPNRKIRVGYISNYLRGHTVGKLMLGWFKNHNRQDFEVYCYYTDRKVDFYTQRFQHESDYFYQISEDFESVCQQIIKDNLDILVFLDIGMHPEMTKIAALRLAPVQCTTWGHPITSGIPTVDYFLSCELMEPENPQQYYSEKLICLPNIGISYTKPMLVPLKKSRKEFGLKEEAIIYLSCQSLFKYLPQYDYVFPTIALKAPQAQFAFVAHESPYITEQFQQRLQYAFAQFGLNSKEYCIIIPQMGLNDYLNLNCISDIFLDTFTWSGGNTTLEAIACNLPIVTCPGEFMRGRHSYGILKMLGVTDTIAQTIEEYIDIAVKLGVDREWRNSIVQRMIERHSYLYDDRACIEALENFYRRVVSEG